jgi:hypothetical protein
MPQDLGAYIDQFTAPRLMKEEVEDFLVTWKYRFTAVIMMLAEVKIG